MPERSAHRTRSDYRIALLASLVGAARLVPILVGGHRGLDSVLDL